MKAIISLSLVLFISCITACSKNKITEVLPPTNNIDVLNQSIIYKTFATIPSPADSARGVFKDSIKVSRTVSINSEEFFKNIQFVTATRSFAGFSLVYNDPSKSLPYFFFTAQCFPDVPGYFQLKKAYTYISPAGNLKPLFLGASNGLDGMNYFVNNVYPPDADFPLLSKTYTSVTFTNRIKIPLPSIRDSAIYASGHISGYVIDYYSKTDTSKYLHRWDFTVDFTDLRLYL